MLGKPWNLPKKIDIMKIRMLKNVLILSCIIFSSFHAVSQIPNFSGLWGLDIPKSNFGSELPSAGVKQLTINQTKDSIIIQRIVASPQDVEYVSTENISLNGNLCTSVMPKGKLTSAITWSPDKKIMTINSSFNRSENPGEIAFRTSQLWSLSKDGSELHVSLTTPGYTVLSVYDKNVKASFTAKGVQEMIDKKNNSVLKIVFYAVIAAGILLICALLILFVRRRK